jgi:predicted acyltransferase
MNSQTRLVSLDAFRGATIAAMILVNNPGQWDASYAQLRHASWHGWTMTDMIFPFFLWIVGVAMTFSFAGRIKRGDARGALFKHAARRSLIIFLLGILVNGFPFGLLFGQSFSFATLRIPGVLQRIAICYAIGSLLVIWTNQRAQAFVMVALLCVYWLLIGCVPVPGFGAGNLSPEGNLVWYIDSTLLKGHTWTFAPAAGFDPEGILSTLPSLATLLAGVLTGRYIRSPRSSGAKAAWMNCSGFGLLLAGLVMDMFLPINKNLWTSSFVVFMAGWALICFSACYWLVDVQKFERWTKPFVILGMNAIVVYVLSEILGLVLWMVSWTGTDGRSVTLHDYLYSAFLVPYLSPPNASLVFAVIFMLMMYAVSFLMWKKSLFVRV